MLLLLEWHWPAGLATDAMDTFLQAELVESRRETPELVHLTLKAPQSLLDAYHVPGQYVKLRLGQNKPGFFAIACGPAHRKLELLIKRGSPLADLICSAPLGQRVEVSLPAGKGYPLEQAQGQDVFLVGVGSGIAPLRALLQVLLAQPGRFGRIVLIYGARTPQAFPYVEEFEQWRQRGVEITRVCSQPPPGAHWTEATGRVQQSLRQRYAKITAPSAAFVCGMHSMVTDVKAAFELLGLPEARVFQNY